MTHISRFILLFTVCCFLSCSCFEFCCDIESSTSYNGTICGLEVSLEMEDESVWLRTPNKDTSYFIGRFDEHGRNCKIEMTFDTPLLISELNESIVSVLLKPFNTGELLEGQIALTTQNCEVSFERN